MALAPWSDKATKSDAPLSICVARTSHRDILHSPAPPSSSKFAVDTDEKPTQRSRTIPQAKPRAWTVADAQAARAKGKRSLSGHPCDRSRAKRGQATSVETPSPSDENTMTAADALLAGAPRLRASDERTTMPVTHPKAIGLTRRIHKDRAVRAARRLPTRGVMATGGFREEVLNVVLAQLLSERGLVSLPETVLKSADGTRLPDVRVVFRGLRTSIEGKYSDVSSAKAVALRQAKERVEEGIAHIGIAVLYPPTLRVTRSMPELHDALASAELVVTAYSEASQPEWIVSHVDGLADLLRRTHELLSGEDVVADAVASIEAAVTRFSRTVLTMPGVLARSADALGIRDVDDKAGK